MNELKQIEELIRTLSKNQRLQLAKSIFNNELLTDDNTLENSSEFKDLLLNGPVMDNEQYQNK